LDSETGLEVFGEEVSRIYLGVGRSRLLAKGRYVPGFGRYERIRIRIRIYHLRVLGCEDLTHDYFDTALRLLSMDIRATLLNNTTMQSLEQVTLQFMVRTMSRTTGL
jgi:hypothetical protein